MTGRRLVGISPHKTIMGSCTSVDNSSLDEVVFSLPDTSRKPVRISPDWNADQVSAAIKTGLGINPSKYWFIIEPHGVYTRPRGHDLYLNTALQSSA